MRRRPLVIVGLAFIAGILVGRYCDPSFFALFALAALFLTAALALHRISPAVSQATLIAALVALGALLYSVSQLPAEALYLQSRSWNYVQGVVASYPAAGQEQTSFLLRPGEGPGYLQVFYFHPEAKPLEIAYGDELRLYAKVRRPEKLNGFDYREYLLQRRIWGTVAVWSQQEIKLVGQGQGNPIMASGYRVRERIFRFADRHLLHSAGLFKALLFGERGYLKESIEEQFRDAGVAHVLAVSGLHLGIIIGLFWLVLRRFHLSVSRIYLALMPIVGFYLLLVGGRVSLIRAAILFGFLALGLVLSERGLILRRWADPYQSLSGAALVILGWNPGALFDVSFQLSFSATLGIILFVRRFEGLSPFKLIRPRWPRGLIVVSLAAQLGVIPFIAWHFQRVYLLVILANLIVIPLVTLALWGGIAFLLAGLFHLPYLPALLGRAEDWLLGALERLTDLLASFPLSYLKFENIVIVLLIYLILVGGLAASLWIRRRQTAP